jgi:hypothetical protein
LIGAREYSDHLLEKEKQEKEQRTISQRVKLSSERLNEEKEEKERLSSSSGKKGKKNNSKNIRNYRKATLAKSMKTFLTLIERKKSLMTSGDFIYGSEERNNSKKKRSKKTLKKCFSRYPAFAGSPSDSTDLTVTEDEETTEEGDENEPASSPSTASSSTEEPEELSSSYASESTALKSLELALGTLGQFSIKVFVDGFLVVNKQDKRQLEISNVGRKSILLREYDPYVNTEATGESKSRTVIGRQGGAVDICTISTSFQLNATHSIRWKR